MAGFSDAAFKRLLATIKDCGDVKVPVGDQFAIVDQADFDLVSAHKWHVSTGYARTTIDGKSISMHRLILGDVKAPEIDHKDGDKLNNRRANLRPCTSTENSQNRRVVGGRSRFKGVRRDRGMWRAQIKVDGKIVDIGFHQTERLAARAYDKAAKKYFGKFACTNVDLNNY